ncbi:AAA family ATPase [Halarcobacter sp.]|uniref:ATP-dependent nuclease n=1 Tax=Halarcobacter sp. TaxID=2321133 RepID=UPI002AA85DCC|nr:AAA family ATPase [Halarcobacter sp.]
MKILEFGVNNFRGISGGIENNLIDFNNTNTIFLFGQNNVGKSTFLKSYEFFFSNQKPTIDDFFKKLEGTKIEFVFMFELDELDFSRIESNAPGKSKSLKDKWLKNNCLKIRRIYELSLQGKIENVKNYTLNNDNENWEYPEENDWKEKNYGGIGLDGVFQSLLPRPIFIKAMPSETEVEDIINSILADKLTKGLKDSEREELKKAQQTIKDLQDKLYNPKAIKKYKKDVNEHFADLFPNIKIELTEKDKVVWSESKFGKKFSIHFNKLKEDGKLDSSVPNSYDKVGHGAIRTAIFTLLLMRDIAEEFKREENRKDYLVLFEEPELFLHPRLMKELRTLIYKVTEDKFPYQVLCASHSPQMIDISKPKSSLIRMINNELGTKLFQINDKYLSDVKEISVSQLKDEMNEVLRFNPFICESFYADEVILIEGPTEEIILRGYFSEVDCKKDIFIVNCGTVNNIPFYQKVFSKFNIKYHVICDTDSSVQEGVDQYSNPIFTSGIQKTIYEQIKLDSDNTDLNVGILRVHNTTFEPAHQDNSVEELLRLPRYTGSHGKPYFANKYWKEILSCNLEHDSIDTVPILKYLKEISEH